MSLVKQRALLLLHGDFKEDSPGGMPSLSCKLSILFRRHKKQFLFEQDFPVFLLSLSSGLRCGLDPISAFLACEELFPENSPVKQAIADSRAELKQGKSTEEVIKNFASDIHQADLQLFRQGLLLAKNQGAAFSPCLQRIAKVVRNRQSFRRKSKSAVSMQKLSALGIIIAVIVMVLIQLIVARETFLFAWSHPLGFKLLSLAAVLLLIGIFWMLWITRLSKNHL